MMNSGVPAEGAFGEAAELPKKQYDIYCPLLDCGDDKRPHKLNYLKTSCDSRLEKHQCNYKSGCDFKKEAVITSDPEYIYMGMGLIRDGSKWNVVDAQGVVILKGAHSIPRCKVAIKSLRDAQGGYHGNDN